MRRIPELLCGLVFTSREAILPCLTRSKIVLRPSDDIFVATGTLTQGGRASELGLLRWLRRTSESILRISGGRASAVG